MLHHYVIEDIEEAARLFQKDNKRWTQESFINYQNDGFGDDRKRNCFCSLGAIEAVRAIRMKEVDGYDDPRLHERNYDEFGEINSLWAQWFNETDIANDGHLNDDHFADDIVDTNDSGSEMTANYMADKLLAFSAWYRQKFGPAPEKPDIMEITRRIVNGD